MDGWTGWDGWMGGWMGWDGCVWMDNVCMDGWMDRWMDGWMDVCMDGKMCVWMMWHSNVKSQVWSQVSGLRLGISDPILLGGMTVEDAQTVRWRYSVVYSLISMETEEDSNCHQPNHKKTAYTTLSDSISNSIRSSQQLVLWARGYLLEHWK